MLKKTITLMYLSMYYNSLQAATYQHSTPDSHAQLHWFYVLLFQGTVHCPRMPSHKKSLLRPKTTSAWKPIHIGLKIARTFQKVIFTVKWFHIHHNDIFFYKVKKDLFQFLLVLGWDTIRISILDLRGTLLLQGIYLDKNSLSKISYI